MDIKKEFCILNNRCFLCLKCWNSFFICCHETLSKNFFNKIYLVQKYFWNSFVKMSVLEKSYL